MVCGYPVRAVDGNGKDGSFYVCYVTTTCTGKLFQCIARCLVFIISQVAYPGGDKRSSIVHSV